MCHVKIREECTSYYVAESAVRVKGYAHDGKEIEVHIPLKV